MVSAGDLIAWSVPLTVMVSLLYLEYMRLDEHDRPELITWMMASKIRIGLLVWVLALWLMPGGAFWWAPSIPVVILLAGMFEGHGMDEWKADAKPLSILVVGLFLGTLAGGIGPVSEPVGPGEWGTPIRTENPDAGFWPAQSQYTWVQADGTILLVTHVRMPGMPSKFHAGESMLSTISATGTDEARLATAAAELSNWVGPETFRLVSTSERIRTHDYGGEVLPYVTHDIRLDLIGERTSAQVFTVALGDWGGEVRLFSIIKPGDEAYRNDPWAEAEVLPWLESQV